MVPHADVIGRRVKLRIASLEDAQIVHQLRSDERRNAHLSPVDPDPDTQLAWLRAYKLREAKGTEFYFVIEDLTEGAVGLLRVYDICEQSFTWGSWIISPGAPSYCAIESALLVYAFAFDRLGLRECHFEVRRENERVWKFHERMGAQRTSEDHLDIRYAYNPYLFASAKRRYERFAP